MRQVTTKKYGWSHHTIQQHEKMARHIIQYNNTTSKSGRSNHTIHEHGKGAGYINSTTTQQSGRLHHTGQQKEKEAGHFTTRKVAGQIIQHHNTKNSPVWRKTGSNSKN